MAKDFARAFYDSTAWRKCRETYIRQRIGVDGGLCEVCHERMGYIVHHKIWLNETNINDPEITLNFKNLRYECIKCHNLEKESGGMKLPAKMAQYAFGPDGEIHGLPPKIF